MKIVALEEHFATPEIMAAWQGQGPELQDIDFTPSGIFSKRHLPWAIEVLVVDRIVFPAVYPYRAAIWQ